MKRISFEFILSPDVDFPNEKGFVETYYPKFIGRFKLGTNSSEIINKLYFDFASIKHFF